MLKDKQNPEELTNGTNYRSLKKLFIRNASHLLDAPLYDNIMLHFYMLQSIRPILFCDINFVTMGLE